MNALPLELNQCISAYLNPQDHWSLLLAKYPRTYCTLLAILGKDEPDNTEEEVSFEVLYTEKIESKLMKLDLDPSLKVSLKFNHLNLNLLNQFLNKPWRAYPRWLEHSLYVMDCRTYDFVCRITSLTRLSTSNVSHMKVSSNDFIIEDDQEAEFCSQLALMMQYLPKTLRALTLDNVLINSQAINILTTNIPYTLEILEFAPEEVLDFDVSVPLAKDLPPRLKRLQLNYASVTSEGALGLARKLPLQLQQLDLSDNDISAETVVQIAKLLPATLVELCLDGIFLGDNGAIDVVKNLPRNLKSLYSACCRIGANGITNMAPFLPPHLTALDIAYNEIGDDAFKELVKHLPLTLEDFEFDNCSISAEGFLALSDRKHLKSLSMASNTITFDQGGQLPHGLLYLNLEDNVLSDQNVVDLADKLPSTLQTLILSLNSLGQDGMMALSEHMPPELLNLELEGCEIDLAGIQILAQNLPPRLHYLNLTRCGLGGPEGILYLASHLPKNLKSLSLQDNEITSELLNKLLPMFPPGLKILSLEYNPIEDDSVVHLVEKIPVGLQELYLDGCAFKDPGRSIMLSSLSQRLEKLSMDCLL